MENPQDLKLRDGESLAQRSWDCSSYVCAFRITGVEVSLVSFSEASLQLPKRSFCCEFRTLQARYPTGGHKSITKSVSFSLRKAWVVQFVTPSGMHTIWGTGQVRVVTGSETEMKVELVHPAVDRIWNHQHRSTKSQSSSLPHFPRNCPCCLGVHPDW